MNYIVIIKKVEKVIETWDKILGIYTSKLITKSLCYNKDDKAFCNKRARLLYRKRFF